MPAVAPSNIQARILSPAAGGIEAAAEALAAGRLVAFPTETVYGLGADATNDRAIADLYAAKARPHFNPLICHLADAQAAAAIGEMDDRAHLLADTFWPGPLTLVLPRTADCPVGRLATAGLDTIAVRVPAHPVARALLAAVGRPIAAPSANRSGTVSATTPKHVLADLGDRIAVMLADGRVEIGLESTVVDLSGPTARLLRPGAVTRADLERAIGPLAAADAAIRSPGQLSSHYAPSVPVRLNARQVAEG
ncbi:MAG: threonylcarbamoyl-AMP synthase, partial [Rhodospirillaceae bacterium]|nr:threonylcarbamoyl-AMP synthase [Rhodospirillaceae bacterium]